MSNAEALAVTRRQEDGYDSFNHDRYEVEVVRTIVRGKVFVYKPRKEAK